MKSVFEAVTTYLEVDEWPIHQIGDTPSYSMTFQGQNGRWTCIAQVVEEDRLLIFYSACPAKTPESELMAVAEYLTRANYNLLLGNFEMNFEDGDIRYKTSISIPEHDMGAMTIGKLIYTNVLTMDRHLPSLLAVINGSLSPLEAINQLPDDV